MSAIYNTRDHITTTTRRHLRLLPVPTEDPGDALALPLPHVLLGAGLRGGGRGLLVSFRHGRAGPARWTRAFHIIIRWALRFGCCLPEAWRRALIHVGGSLTPDDPTVLENDQEASVERSHDNGHENYNGPAARLLRDRRRASSGTGPRYASPGPRFTAGRPVRTDRSQQQGRPVRTSQGTAADKTRTGYAGKISPDRGHSGQTSPDRSRSGIRAIGVARASLSTFQWHFTEGGVWFRVSLILSCIL